MSSVQWEEIRKEKARNSEKEQKKGKGKELGKPSRTK